MRMAIVLSIMKRTRTWIANLPMPNGLPRAERRDRTGEILGIIWCLSMITMIILAIVD